MIEWQDFSSPYEIGNRRELFPDDFLTWRRNGIERKIHEPAAHPPEKTQPVGYYMTMLQREGKIHCYYRSDFGKFTGPDSPYSVKPGFIGEYTAYAQSTYGIKFLSPPLFLHDCGVPDVLLCMRPGVHNFVPFYDENPDCPADERYKAVAGVSDQGGLFGFVSPDPIYFRQIGTSPLIPARPEWGYCMDSQNVAFWSEAEQCYVCYFRINTLPSGEKARTVCRVTSRDFQHWSEPEYPQLNYPGENLYVSLLAPYPRAKHFYIGTPTRYFEDRGSATDIALIFSRAGGEFIRPGNGTAWIKPGPDEERWKNRSNYLAYNIVQTSPEEMSLYHARSGVRYTLRTDGFISLSAGAETGEWISKVIKYDGGTLEFNLSTSAGGSFQVELQTPDGKPIPGYSLAEHILFYGDRISYVPEWTSAGRAPLVPGTALRIRCVMKDCDLYSVCFNKTT